MKCYKFQLKPSKIQEQILNKNFDLCRFCYNKLLEKMNIEKKVDRNIIQHFIVELKRLYPDLRNVYSKTLQYECYRLFSNLKGLSKSKKNGHKVGRLRFKGQKWFKTIVYNQSGFELIERSNHYNILKLSKIGNIKLRQHRLIEGNIKGIIIKKKVNTWEAHIITDGEYLLESGQDIIGIDMGVLSFITTSNNDKFENPLYMNKSLKKIQYLSRNISRTKKGSNNRKRLCLRLQKLWEHIDNQKKDYFHKITTKLVNNSKYIAVEDLNIKSMSSNKKNKFYNHRNILDSSWGLFLQLLQFKAESAGVVFKKINPYNTSKKCSRCGRLKDMPLNVRIYKCECGLELDRDHNAAINILNRAMGREPTFVGENQLLFSMNQEAMSSTL